MFEQKQSVLSSVVVIMICAATFFTINACTNNVVHENTHKKESDTISTSTDVDFGPYMGNLQRNIKAKWLPPKGQESKRVVVSFKVDVEGALSHLKIDKSSGIADQDAAALRAVEDAAPFGPLPKGADKAVDIQFTFDYNTFKNENLKGF
jgi:TonB family protein